MLFEGGTPLNNPPIEKHANSSMFALIFWPHVTIFCIFWLHECLKWILKFNLKSLFWCQSRQIFEVRAIEQRHHEFQLIHMPPHQFWPRYHSDGLSPVHVRFEFFSKQICNVEALICHFYKNIKTLTQIHFPRDAHIFRTCTIFYRHYKGLHQMRKDLVLCAHRPVFVSVCQIQTSLKLLHLLYNSIWEIDSHIWMLTESLQAWFCDYRWKVRPWISPFQFLNPEATDHCSSKKFVVVCFAASDDDEFGKFTAFTVTFNAEF